LVMPKPHAMTTAVDLVNTFKSASVKVIT
jgi:hypothetical protein